MTYAKRPFANAQRVFRYLGRYSHRVAIANSRLVSLEDGQVCFRWKDYADEHLVKLMCVSADEFLRRFLLHGRGKHACDGLLASGAPWARDFNTSCASREPMCSRTSMARSA